MDPSLLKSIFRMLLDLFIEALFAILQRLICQLQSSTLWEKSKAGKKDCGNSSKPIGASDTNHSVANKDTMR